MATPTYTQIIRDLVELKDHHKGVVAKFDVLKKNPDWIRASANEKKLFDQLQTNATDESELLQRIIGEIGQLALIHSSEPYEDILKEISK